MCTSQLSAAHSHTHTCTRAHTHQLSQESIKLAVEFESSWQIHEPLNMGAQDFHMQHFAIVVQVAA